MNEDTTQYMTTTQTEFKDRIIHNITMDQYNFEQQYNTGDK